jgi:hypothetical protein
MKDCTKLTLLFVIILCSCLQILGEENEDFYKLLGFLETLILKK